MRSASVIAIEAEPSATLTSRAIPVAQQEHASVIIDVVGSTGAGAVSIEASNDSGSDAFPVGNATPSTWKAITGATVNVSGTGTYIIPAFVIAYQFIRVVFTYTSGSGGTLTAKVTTAG